MYSHQTRNTEQKRANNMQMNNPTKNTAPFGATDHEHPFKEDPTTTQESTTEEQAEEEEDSPQQGEQPDPMLLRRSIITAQDEEENYPDPDSLQEELNEILEAWFDLISEEDIAAYQRYIEDIRGERVAERALLEPALAPTFSLEDQDGEQVHLETLLNRGKPVVLVFYRGKWCPHCNATLMRYQKDLLPALQQQHVPLVAISPMLPDGTVFLASKRTLQFAVCSDPQNSVAQQFGITFQVQPHTQPFMEKWGEDVPLHNGVPGDWTLPIPAVYVIGTDGRIAWSFLDNDAGVRAEPGQILQAVAAATTPSSPTTTPTSSLHKQIQQQDEATATASAHCTNSLKNRRRAERDRGDAYGAPDSPLAVSKKKKKLFNRKTGYISLRKSCQGLLARVSSSSSSAAAAKSNDKVASKQVHPHNDDDDSGDNNTPKPLLLPPSPFRSSSQTHRTFRSSQTSSEFLTNYVLPPPEGV